MSESRVIYKYILGESNVIEIPENPIFLKVAVQGEVTVLWVLVDPHNEKKELSGCHCIHRMAIS